MEKHRTPLAGDLRGRSRAAGLKFAACECPFVKVLIPSPLRPDTGRVWVDAEGATLGAVLVDLERRFPGIRFRMVNEQERIRPHVRMFVGGAQVFDLGFDVQGAEEILIVQALSGG